MFCYVFPLHSPAHVFLVSSLFGYPFIRFNLPHKCFVPWRTLLHFLVRPTCQITLRFFRVSCAFPVQNSMRSFVNYRRVPLCTRRVFSVLSYPLYRLFSKTLPLRSVMRSFTLNPHPTPIPPAEFLNSYLAGSLQGTFPCIHCGFLVPIHHL